MLKFHTENEHNSLFPKTEEFLKDDTIQAGMYEEHGMFTREDCKDEDVS